MGPPGDRVSFLGKAIIMSKMISHCCCLLIKKTPQFMSGRQSAHILWKTGKLLSVAQPMSDQSQGLWNKMSDTLGESLKF